MELTDRPYSPWNGAQPFITHAISLRYDMLERRYAGLKAILRWQDGWRLWADARAEIDRMFAEDWPAWDRDVATLEAAWCSWPPEVAA